jgi:hypothetical protein
VKEEKRRKGHEDKNPGFLITYRIITIDTLESWLLYAARTKFHGSVFCIFILFPGGWNHPQTD